MRVAFIGRRHVGKSQAAKVALEYVFPRGHERPAHKLAFADPLKNAYVESVRTFESEIGSLPRFTRSELDRTKDQHRYQLEFFGTTFGRERFGDTLWLDLMQDEINNYTYETLVVDDCRFLNEARLLEKNNFTLIRIDRGDIPRAASILATRGVFQPTVEQMKDVLAEEMPSEVEVDKISCHTEIWNDGTSTFHKLVRQRLNGYR